MAGSPQLGALLPQPTICTEAPPPLWAFPFCQELTPDYSMESHQRDHENYVACLRSHRRRAKALLDFERHDDDELGFRKNDIITVRVGLLTFPVESERMLNKLDLSPAGMRTPALGRP